jgi:uncharacterized heparinase superfamily protein
LIAGVLVTISRALRIAFLLRVVGPRPRTLAQTFVFLASKTHRERQRRRLYGRPLPPASVELCLPRIGLAARSALPRQLQPAADRLRSEADHVLGHRVDILGSGLTELGPEIDWHLDFKSGYSWPRRFYSDVEVTRLHDRSDAKVPWELSRCHHLLTLARAARVFEDDRYAAELERQLSSWLEANPPGVGINWTNPMEVGIRAVNLVWAVATLEEWRELEPGLRGRLVHALRWHGRHIAANLEGTPYLRSNHYLGDILGLLVLGSALQGDPAAQRWSEFACRELEHEIVKQVYTDGVSFEGSLGYHGLALEMFLIARYVSAWAGTPLSPKFDEQLHRMVAVSQSVRHPDGRTPLFGDQDSGRILPDGFERPPTHDNLLWLAAAVLGTRGPPDGPVHPEVAWTFGVDAWRGATNSSSPPGPAAFPHGGIYVLQSKRTHAVAHCGDVGQNGFGGHSHNDVLAYELSIDGLPLIVDSGTYAYTFDVEARNEFRSTLAHNTVVIDGQEIHPIDPTRVFELRRFARPKVEVCNFGSQRLELVGSHDGYRRLPEPIVHRRRFSLTSATDELLIEDELVGSGTHTLQSSLHLAPGVSLRQTDRARYEVERDNVRATIAFRGVDADELIVDDGWVSGRYGIRERAPVLRATVHRTCPARFGYSVAPVRT